MKALLGVVAALVVVTACGGTEPKEAESTPPRPSPTETLPTTDPYVEELAEATTASRRACSEVFGDLLTTLEELGSRLSVGLRLPDYGTEVGDIHVSYDQALKEAATLDGSCLTAVGVKLETALNHYTKANRLWSDCVSDFDCDMDDVDPKIQARWQKARSQVEAAAEAIDTYPLSEDDRPVRS
ncbi:hypothetical protein FE697_015350 [Mumia zhuanghuii]|uniref:Uncharacterized protein n=2 Tax=Mumia TaxID=1546255 RepID=A0ABW1QSX1_9ACTN|nr:MULTISPECIES: hypothetical protein [Mumia]KAA1422508.1 hypothetical protein FE697_015350 [Mumia zhuanghuii]